MDKKIRGDPQVLYDASLHLINAGGKRLRPFMTLKFHGLYSEDESAVIPAAAAVELVHNFTLIHDDIMDRDDIRHGVPTVHKRFGEPLAILAGDVLFAEAFKLVAETPSLAGDYRRLDEAVELLAESLIVLCEGQAIDVKAATDELYTEKQYYEIIKKKTAALFEAASVMGVIAGGGGKEDMVNARMYARNVGIGFQIVDDLLGVVGDSAVTGKPVGNDLKEGKKTLPIFMAVQRSRERDRTLLLKVWGNVEAKQEEVEAAVEVLRRLEIDKAARNLALDHVEKAVDYLGKLPGEDKHWLADLARYVVERKI
ncbi:MAG: polyprenyl synthetase family protein [Conexivisphaerales archaeon]|jgi:geranylgeranyl diphosphate synthase type I